MDTTQIPKPKRFFLYDTDRNRFVELTPYLAAGFVLGREEGNETFPDDDTMSHCHARLSFDETGAIQLEDLGATNGTRLNDVALTKGEKRRVALHDRVGVGRQEFILTNQNQYRPVAAGKIKDLTLVAQAAAQDQYEPPPAPPADPDATVVHPVRVRYRPPREKRPGLPKLSPQALALGAVLLAVAAVTLWGGRLPSRASKKAAPQANLVPGAAKANGLRFPDGRESYWEAQPVEGNPDLLYFRNVGILTRKATFLAMRENIEVLKRALTLPPEQAGFLLDENPDLETLADSACDGIRQKPERFPPIPLVSVLQEIAGGSEGAMEELRSEKTGPLGATLIGSRLSTVRFPPLDGRIEIASIVLRCGEMSGQRLNQAQRRGTLFHLMQARDALGARLLRHEHQMVQNTTDKGSRESIKAMRLTVQFKAVGSLLRQNEAYARELASDAQAEALTGVTAGFSSLLKSDLTEVARAYEKGRFVFPIFYPPLKPEAVLAEADLLFLSAY